MNIVLWDYELMMFNILRSQGVILLVLEGYIVR